MKNCINGKILYIFRVHNKDVEIKIFERIKRRRFAISYLEDEWNEYSTINEFTTNRDVLNLGCNERYNYMVRVYFNNEHNRNRFMKEIGGLIED